MSIKGKAYLVGAYEHPTRKAGDKSVAQLHAEVAKGALEDAGLTKQDVDGYFCAGDAPGLGPLSMADYMGLRLRHMESTDTGGSSYLIHVAHAAQAIAAGKCNVALVTLAGRPRSEGSSGTQPRNWGAAAPDGPFEAPYGIVTANSYAMVAMRHMHEYGTTSEQLAWIKVAASHHAQHNPHAMLREVVTVKDVLDSPVIADPLHRLDCCVVSDGGGALIVARPEIARSLKRPLVKLIGAGESPQGQAGGKLSLTTSGAAWSGAAASSNSSPSCAPSAALSTATATSVFESRERGSRFMEPRSTHLRSTTAALACRLAPDDSRARAVFLEPSPGRRSCSCTPQASSRGR